MREIKFRAWLDGKVEYFGLDGISTTGDRDEASYINARFNFYYCGDFNPDMVIEQFIGLRDKNGKEIYEGDILQRPGNQGRIGVVQFASGMFGLNWEYKINNDPEWIEGIMYGSWGSECNLRTLNDGFNRELEVIGNIHENTELLA